ncbi:MAG: phosphotransferase family protein [Anaerolineales bacterium]
MTVELDLPSLSDPALERLTEFLRNQHPELVDLKLIELDEFTEGWETDLYRLRLTGTRDGLPTDKELVLRLYKGADPILKAQLEFSIMTGVSQFGLPTPRVDALVTDPSVLGDPFLVMEYIAGGTLDDKIKSSEIPHFLDPMVEMLAKIHALPWRELIPDPGESLPRPDEPLAFIRSQLQQMDATVDRFKLTDFAPTMAWLREREVLGVATSPVLIHNDFHPQNILLRNDEMVIIDWSFAEIGDYRMDLAWSVMLTGVMVGQELRPVMLEAYERAAGSAVENLEYFEVLKFTMRMLTIAAWLDETVDIPVAGITKQAIRGDYKVHVMNPYRRLKQITRIPIRMIEEL